MTNQELVRRLERVAAHLQNAIEDAAEDFAAGLSHAGIAMGELRETLGSASPDEV